jgi:hypothetical protein
MNSLDDKNEEKILEIMESLYDDFMDDLYSIKGVNKDVFVKLIDVLQECEQKWKTNNYIPKRAANIFMDAYSAIMSTLDLYASFDEKNDIEFYADRLQEAIRNCCAI